MVENLMMKACSLIFPSNGQLSSILVEADTVYKSIYWSAKNVIRMDLISDMIFEVFSFIYKLHSDVVALEALLHCL